MRKELKYAVIQTLPVMAGYLVLGMSFGLLMKINGFGLGLAILMSTCIYAGSMQFVAISLLTGGASILTTAITTLMVNARHLFYGISMINRYKGAGLKKIYLMFALTDETYSLVCQKEIPDGIQSNRYYFFVSLLNQCYWIMGTLLGVLAGSVITFDMRGIDFCMTALFVTVFVEQWISEKEHLPACIGVGATIICLILFGRDSFLIPSMLVITIGLLLFRKTIEKREAVFLDISKKRE